MKSLFVALALASTAVSVNAGDARTTAAPPRVSSNAPVCPDGEIAVAHYINGKLTWVCEPEV